jgi:hypothetical protein
VADPAWPAWKPLFSYLYMKDSRVVHCFWLIVPLWMPFVAIAGLTAYLWRRDLRVLPGHCGQCGYNLTGNASGVCPECGEATHRSEPRDKTDV